MIPWVNLLQLSRHTTSRDIKMTMAEAFVRQYFIRCFFGPVTGKAGFIACNGIKYS